MKDYFDLAFNKASYFTYIEFNPITGRKYFFDVEKNDYFALRDTVEDTYFWHITPNAKSLFNSYNKAKGDIARIAQNYPIQGTAGDITKYACVLFFKEILKRNWWMEVKIVNLVHDELLLECPRYLEEKVKEVLISSMENAGTPFCPVVPLKAEAISGDHWVH